jgi:hypothetical protein
VTFVEADMEDQPAPAATPFRGLLFLLTMIATLLASGAISVLFLYGLAQLVFLINDRL